MSKTEQIYIVNEFPPPVYEIDEQVSYQFVILTQFTGYVKEMDVELSFNF
jgi:hypothetical protein